MPKNNKLRELVDSAVKNALGLVIVTKDGLTVVQYGGQASAIITPEAAAAALDAVSKVMDVVQINT